jgi:hypothetical protein
MSEEDLITPAQDHAAEDAASGIAGFVKDHPALVIAGGLALGLAAAALVPSSTRRRIARGTAAAASAASEAGLRLGKQGDSAGEARRIAGEAASQARDTGIDWAKAAVALLGALRR